MRIENCLLITEACTPVSLYTLIVMHVSTFVWLSFTLLAYFPFCSSPNAVILPALTLPYALQNAEIRTVGKRIPKGSQFFVTRVRTELQLSC